MQIGQSIWEQQVNKIAQYAFIFFAFCIPMSLALENTGFVLSLLFALLSGLWWRYRKQILLNPFSILLICLFLLFIIGLFYTEASYAWRLRVFKKESEIVAILFLLPVISFKENFLINVMKGYVLGCIVVALISWLGAFHLLPHAKWFNHQAPYYIFFHIYASLFMAFGAYLAVILLKLNWQKHTRWLWLVIFILITYNVLWQSMARTGYIVYMILAIVFCLQYFSGKGKFLSILVIMVALILILAGSTHFREGISRVVNNGKNAVSGQVKTSTGVRYEYLRNSLTLWQQKPILGHGTGGFRAADVKIKGTNFDGGVTTTKNAQVTPENTFYRILVEHGAVGLIVLILLWGWQLFKAFSIEDVLTRNLAVAFMLTMIFASMSQDLLIDESPRLFYILFSTLLYAPMIMQKNRYP